MIALVTVGAGGPGVGGVVLFVGRKRFFGANQWSIGVSGQDRSMRFDGSTSMVAEGKVRFALAKGVALPPGCIIDRDGIALPGSTWEELRAVGQQFGVAMPAE